MVDRGAPAGLMVDGRPSGRPAESDSFYGDWSSEASSGIADQWYDGIPLGSFPRRSDQMFGSLSNPVLAGVDVPILVQEPCGACGVVCPAYNNIHD